MPHPTGSSPGLLNALGGWRPPDGWTRVRTLDAHAAGEPLRIVLSGAPYIPGATMPEKRRWAMEHLDELRRLLVWEPRGHADMYGCILTEPVTADADFGVLFLHNAGFSTMCGHAVIALTTVLVETGVVLAEQGIAEVRIDSPAGRITAVARLDGDRVAEVAFRNVASFVLNRDLTVAVPGAGEVRCDIAFGGAFYAICDASALGLRLTPDAVGDIIAAGRAVKAAAAAAAPIRHPDEPELGFLYGTIFVGPSESPECHSRNVCVFADGELDRSPTGTGVSARAALLAERGELADDEAFVVESIIGSRFTTRVVGRTRCGEYDAVVPEVSGSAHLTGRAEWWLDPRDPLVGGFLLR